MTNMPDVKLGIVAVSRDCFPKSLSENRRPWLRPVSWSCLRLPRWWRMKGIWKRPLRR